MILFITVLKFSLILALMSWLGFGSTYFLSGGRTRASAFLVSAPVGYVLFCLVSIWLTAAFPLALSRANVYAGLFLSGVTLAALSVREARASIRMADVRVLGMFATLCAVYVFFPVLSMGADGYLGTVNPDFYQSMAFQEVLTRLDTSFWVDRATLELSGPFLGMFPDAFQARFGGVAFSVLVQQLLSCLPREALVLSLMGFMTCLPVSLFYFCRTVLDFSRTESLLSGILIVLAAPTVMSFMHTFIGQNSALSVFPLALALSYNAIVERSLKLGVLAALVLNGLFYIYVMALPYIVVPILLFIAVMLVLRKMRPDRMLSFVLLSALATTLALHAASFATTSRFLKDLFSLLGQMTQSHYYADFLTEEVLEYATGLTSYPLSQSYLFADYSHLAPYLLIALAGVIALLYFWFFILFSRSARTSSTVLVASMLATYIAVWFKYTFLMRYGYASFKMSAWLQFIFVPFMAWGMVHVVRHRAALFGSLKSKILSVPVAVVLFLLFPVLNVLAGLDYGFKSFGRDLYHGSLVNSYGLSGSRSLASLTENLQKHVPAGARVAVGFGDSVENFWVSYYVYRAGLRTSILTHEEIPFEDAHLPDVRNRTYMDSMGHQQLDVQKYFNGGHADYLLLPGPANLNSDAIVSPRSGTPVWSDGHYALYKSDQVRDVVLTGRGYYRVEHMETDGIPWWWPGTFRWSAQGGEIYQFLPASTSHPYYIAFSAIAGLGQPNGERTIEVWVNGRLHDVLSLHGAARLVARPYLPVAGPNRIVLRVKERSVLVARKGGLWNRDLPRRSTPINVLFTDISVSPAPEDGRVVPVGSRVEPKAMFRHFVRFDGFDVDGWIRRSASFSVKPAAPVRRVRMHMLIPGNLGFGFPFAIRFVIDGKEVIRTVDGPGEAVFDFEAGHPSRPDILAFTIVPAESRRLMDGFEQREVLQSVRLSSIELE